MNKCLSDSFCVVPGLDKAIRTRRGPLVLLFYDGFEMKAEKGLSGALYSGSRRTARYLYRTLTRKQVWTGFYTAFKSLRLCLTQYGCDVRVNDHALAETNSNYPIGLAGYPTVLEKVRSNNPVIFGPGDFGYPDTAAVLAKDPRIRTLIQPSEWVASLYRAGCLDKIMVWPVGIDTELWKDSSSHPKDLDILIYDKIRWNRDREVPRVLDRIEKHIRSSGYSFATLRYGHHHHRAFAQHLKRARSLVFLCEHETQGLAYQEALAANVPVMAWDEGRLVDPLQRSYADPGLRVSSVPYFDDRCGMRFVLAEFEDKLEEFWRFRNNYRPRDYIEETLSLKKAAQAYLTAYSQLI